MPTYVTLAEYTQHGIENVTEGADLTGLLESTADATGGELHDVYLTFGEYDLVVISEFPDDRSYAQFALGVAGEGALTTETLKGFTGEEYRDLVDDLGDLQLGGVPGGVPGEFDEG